MKRLVRLQLSMNRLARKLILRLTVVGRRVSPLPLAQLDFPKKLLKRPPRAKQHLGPDDSRPHPLPSGKRWLPAAVAGGSTLFLSLLMLSHQPQSGRTAAGDTPACSQPSPAEAVAHGGHSSPSDGANGSLNVPPQHSPTTDDAVRPVVIEQHDVAKHDRDERAAQEKKKEPADKPTATTSQPATVTASDIEVNSWSKELPRTGASRTSNSQAEDTSSEQSGPPLPPLESAKKPATRSPAPFPQWAEPAPPAAPGVLTWQQKSQTVSTSTETKAANTSGGKKRSAPSTKDDNETDKNGTDETHARQKDRARAHSKSREGSRSTPTDSSDSRSAASDQDALAEPQNQPQNESGSSAKPAERPPQPPESPTADSVPRPQTDVRPQALGTTQAETVDQPAATATDVEQSDQQPAALPESGSTHARQEADINEENQTEASSPEQPASEQPVSSSPQTEPERPADGWQTCHRPLPEAVKRKQLLPIPPRPKQLKSVNRGELGLERTALPSPASVPRTGGCNVLLTTRFPQQVEAGRRFLLKLQLTIHESAEGPMLVCLPVPKTCRVLGAAPRPFWRAEGLVWRVDDMANGQTRQFQVELEATRPGRIYFRPRLFAGLKTARMVSVASPHLGLNIHPLSRPVLGRTYPVAFSITNKGSVAVENVVLQVDLPPQLDYPYGRLLQYEVGKLAPGQSQEARLTARVVRPGPFAIKARLVSRNSSTKEVVLEAATEQP